MQLSSPQMAEQRTMPAQGKMWIAGRGSAVQAGESLRFHFTNLPHHRTWPRNLALALAVIILAGGAWSAARMRGTRAAQADERRKLEATRDRLFDELTSLELRHREQGIDRYAERRHELISALERVYVALDDEAAAGRAS
jgi:cell division protein FtsB